MAHSIPLTPSDLIFPEASKSLATTLTSLKRSNLSITNRLLSIKQDADFVQKVAEAYQLPLVANERCGSWYIHPDQKTESVYFKSTDGHFGQWSFNLRRLNLHLLDVIAKYGGCIIVDSTRRGKRMPDALSKTVPIWIAVLNRFLAPDNEGSDSLMTPENVVSRSEQVQIEERLPRFVQNLKALDLDAVNLRSKMCGKPLEPLWVTPGSNLPKGLPRPRDKHLIILCTASGRNRSPGQEHADYVQGAADDSESWACGLEAASFWANSRLLLSTPEDDLPRVIHELVGMRQESNRPMVPVIIESTNVSIGNNASVDSVLRTFDTVISCSETPNAAAASKLRSRYIHLRCTTGKRGSRELRLALPKLEALPDILCKSSKLLVTCSSGRDLAVGVALAVLCRFYPEHGSLETEGFATRLDKRLIKQRLSRIMLSMPEAAPSGATLQSVNAYLLGNHRAILHETPIIQSSSEPA